jgi:hypothetical protein
MPGADRNAVDEQRAGAIDHGRGVVVAPRARPGDHDDQVGGRRTLPHRCRDPFGVVRDDRARRRLAAGLARLRDEHERVRVDELAGRRLGAERPHLVARRDDVHARGAADAQRGVARGRRGGEVDRPQPVPLGQQQLRRAHVLPDRAHVLPRRDGGAHRRHVALPVDVLAHDDGVEAVRQRVARVDDGEPRHRLGRRLGRPHGVRRPHRDAVHRARVVGGRRAERPDGRGGHAPERVLQRHVDGLGPPAAERAEPRGERLRRRHVVQEEPRHQ